MANQRRRRKVVYFAFPLLIHFQFLRPPSFISHPIYLFILYSFLSQDPSNGVTMRRWLDFPQAWEELHCVFNIVRIRALLNNFKLLPTSAHVLKILFHTQSTKTPDMFRSSSDHPQGVLHRTSIYTYAPHNDGSVGDGPLFTTVVSQDFNNII
jgi:hypothetical protein